MVRLKLKEHLRIRSDAERLELVLPLTLNLFACFLVFRISASGDRLRLTPHPWSGRHPQTS
ncbi:hypothetical protein BDM02DRAFT_523580 [Thelephora ganbajun]|uniref:Uncharacterized protein n=1 Tax=Thelephora ganbajun TaxID=370292 RepID=A0ACB6ZQI8_THEGA|nr:hypothetical protein BDM02DRAFT_523580 [Thelephora ganbajun]